MKVRGSALSQDRYAQSMPVSNVPNILLAEMISAVNVGRASSCRFWRAREWDMLNDARERACASV
jgi:hypothetical protein